MKNHLTSRILFALFLGFAPSAFATPLKELLLIFSDTQVTGSTVDWTASSVFPQVHKPQKRDQ